VQAAFSEVHIMEKTAVPSSDLVPLGEEAPDPNIDVDRPQARAGAKSPNAEVAGTIGPKAVRSRREIVWSPAQPDRRYWRTSYELMDTRD